ncbi:MAG TPA: hypothetical protein VGZ32_04610 [Actinocrinis sp.]|nr:hypothetical protein [Actinocrinis sp.]
MAAWARQQVHALRDATPHESAPLGALKAEYFEACGARVGVRWVRGFTFGVGRFAVWSGLLFASWIGALVWAIGLPVGHAPAVAMSVVYALIALISAVAARGEAWRLLDQLRRLAPVDTTQARDRTGAFVSTYVGLLAIASALYGVLAEVRIRRAAHAQLPLFAFDNEFGAFVLVALCGAVLGAFIMALAYADALGPRGPRQAVSWPLRLLGSAVAPLVRARRAVGGNAALDSAVLRLLEATARIAQLGAQQRADGTPPGREAVVSLVALLERAAGDAEEYALVRVPRLDLAARTMARKDGAQLAGLVRAAKAPLARALHPDEYSAMSKALTQILAAWCDPSSGGFADLVSAAPAPDRLPLWRRAGSRIGNAVLLAAAGIVLPALPVYSHQQAAAAGARYTLLTAAVFALATGKVTAWDTVSTTLDNLAPAAPAAPQANVGGH